MRQVSLWGCAWLKHALALRCDLVRSKQSRLAELCKANENLLAKLDAIFEL